MYSKRSRTSTIKIPLQITNRGNEIYQEGSYVIAGTAMPTRKLCIASTKRTIYKPSKILKYLYDDMKALELLFQIELLFNIELLLYIELSLFMH